MPEVIGIDHIYVTVSDLERSEKFYDTLMAALLFGKNRFEINDEPHIQYYNRHFGFVLRPAHTRAGHDSYSPGLHHLCFRVDSAEEVSKFVTQLKATGLDPTEPELYPEYAPDYMATFVTDPDGIRLEVTNFRKERRARFDRAR